CVRFTSEVSRSNLLGIVDRGSRAYIERLNPDESSDVYSDNVIGLCPTGALLSRDFLYKSRVWFLEPVRSVCNGCARVCSVDVWRRKKERQARAPGEEKDREIYRVTAHDDPEINGPWLCNKGFDLHKMMDRERPPGPLLEGMPSSIERALDVARGLLAQAKRPAALVSAQASNEELDAFAAALQGRCTIYTREDCRPGSGEVVEDDLLIKADKNPNSYGVRMRFGSVPFTADVAGDHDLFLIWGEWDDYASLGRARLIHLTAFAKQQEFFPEVLIPLSMFLERRGSFCNFEGRVNRFEAVFDKPRLAEHAERVFAGLRP
ncbi:MAG TPA: hypothetical protein VI653_19170, partial [Steroidobacteraceae bacterium]